MTRLLYLIFFASGATSPVYEVIWVRLTGLVFGNTAFSISRRRIRLRKLPKPTKLSKAEKLQGRSCCGSSQYRRDERSRLESTTVAGNRKSRPEIRMGTFREH